MITDINPYLSISAMAVCLRFRAQTIDRKVGFRKTQNSR